jgi:hypothetical protein
MVFTRTLAKFKALLLKLAKCVGYESWRAFWVYQAQLWDVTGLAKLCDNGRKPRPKPADIPNYRDVPDCFTEKLTVLRYSQNTLKTYTDCFGEFINYYSNKDLPDITPEEIQS